MLSDKCGERKVHADLSTPEPRPLPYAGLPQIGNGHETTVSWAFMADDAESGASRGPVYNSIACDPCRQKKRRCSHDPSKCRYPEENKRGLPPGYTAKLEARLAETEAALFQVLSRTNGRQTFAWSGDTPSVPSSVSAGNQNKAERVKEWESLPLRSSADVVAWFRWKSAATSPDGRRPSMTEPTGIQGSNSLRLESGWASESMSVGNLSSPDQERVLGSASTRDTATPEQRSSRAKELSRSQCNVYF